MRPFPALWLIFHFSQAEKELSRKTTHIAKKKKLSTSKKTSIKKSTDSKGKSKKKK